MILQVGNEITPPRSVGGTWVLEAAPHGHEARCALRESLGEAQLRIAVQGWHFKQMGARLIGWPESASGA